MYNHITNGWAEEHRVPLDVRYPEAQEHILQVLEDWLNSHPKTDVVRFTTFFYNFDLIYNQYGKENRLIGLAILTASVRSRWNSLSRYMDMT